MASEIIVQTIKGPTSGANANKILIPSGQTLEVSGGTLVPSTGQIVQAKTTSISTVLSTTSTSFTGITGLAVTLTPSSSSSRLLIIVNLATEVSYVNSNDRGIDFAIYQDGTEIYRADYELYNSNDGSQRIQKSTAVVDVAAGTTSSTTINMNYRSTRSGNAVRINQYGSPSTITVMEIAQ